MSDIPSQMESSYVVLDSLWIKYCGLVDEFDMLEDKWAFARGEDTLTALPRVRRSFEKLNDLSGECKEIFEQLGFFRAKPESMKAFNDAVVDYPQDYVLGRRVRLTFGIEELSKYMELLRAIFFQRTVSDDISQTVVGFPHSPERTSGNELIYLAADKVARAYYHCFEFKDPDWDGVVSFIYPTVSGHLHGAFMWHAPFSGLFHLSLSGENKYFPGSLILLSHEMGHASMSITHSELDGVWRDYDHKNWVKVLYQPFLHQMRAIKATYLDSLFPESARCGNCILRKLEVLSEHDYAHIFCECIADLLSMETAGPGAISCLSDSAPSYPQLFRIGFLAVYYSGDQNRQQALLEEMFRLEKNLMTEHSANCHGQEQAKICVEAFTTISAQLGGGINSIQQSFKDVVAEYFPDLHDQYLESFAELGLENEGFVDDGSILSRVIKPRFRFELSYPEQSRIEESLRDCKPIYDVDPRKILDVYFRRLRRQAEPPSFATLVSSLAFNETIGNSHEDD